MLPWHPPAAFSAAQPQSQQPSPSPADSSSRYLLGHGPPTQQSTQQQPSQPQQQQQHQNQAQGLNQIQNQSNPQQAQQDAAQAQAPPPPITLASVLHFLQTEHRRYARDRNEWEIERAEMRARIALLEGEKRGNEGALRDLGRRCKMLENALRGERSKFLSTTGVSLPHGGLATSASGTSSPIHVPPPPGAGAAIKLPKDTAPPPVSESSPMAPSTSSQGTAPPITISTPPAPPSAPTTPGVTSAPGQAPGSRASSSMGVHAANGAGGTLNVPGGVRDPRGRARSRDYLKQCLQEITYLTSSTTLNPLAATSFSAPTVPRPRKVLPEFVLPPSVPGQPHQQQPGIINLSLPPPIPSITTDPSPAPPVVISSGPPQPPATSTVTSTTSAAALTAFPSDPASAFVPLKRVFSSPGIPASSLPPMSPPPSLPTTLAAVTVPPLSSTPTTMSPPLASGPFQIPEPAGTSPPMGSSPPLPLLGAAPATPTEATKTDADTVAQSQSPRSATPASTPITSTIGSDSVGPVVARPRPPVSAIGAGTGDASRLTAIFKPESGEKWRERLREAGQSIDASGTRTVGGERELEELKWELGDDEGEEGRKVSSEEHSESGKGWLGKKTLRSHLDGVRAVAFAQDQLALVSGSDDMTVKLWRLDPESLGTLGKSMMEIEPQMTYRLHTAPVTAVILDSASCRIYSASLDSKINVFALPPASHDTYGSLDLSLHLATFVGHADGVWGLALLPHGRLVSISADGSTKVWDTTKLDDPLRLSWDYDGTGGAGSGGGGKKKLPVPTAVVAVGESKVAIAYENSVVKLFEVDTGKELLRLKSDETFDGTQGTQINAVLAHPTLPLIVTAHEDKYIRVFDINTGQCTRSQVTHLDGVTSLALDPSGGTLASVGHDTSLRFWDLDTLACVQEISAHRPKSAEGILDVAFHPTLPYLATAGADGTVKLWGTS